MGTPADFVAGSADLVRGLAPTGALPGRPGEASSSVAPKSPTEPG